MIYAAAMEAHPVVGKTLLGATGGSFIFGVTVAQVSQMMQIGAFAVAIISGLAATAWYVIQSYYKIREKRDATRQ